MGSQGCSPLLRQSRRIGRSLAAFWFMLGFTMLAVAGDKDGPPKASLHLGGPSGAVAVATPPGEQANLTGAKSEADQTARARLDANYGRLPLSFEANRGQADGRVKFLSRGRGYTLFLTADEAVLALKSHQSPAVSSQSHPAKDTGPRTTDRRLGGSIDNHQSRIDNASSLAPTVLRVKLAGAKPAPEVTGLDELPGKSNYFIGNDPAKWRANVPNYAKVRYEEVYPGIDLVYYGNQRQLEYDFVVAPGADPRAIRLRVDGAVAPMSSSAAGTPPLQIDANGDLVISTDGGEVRFHKPVVYQVPAPVAAQHGRRTTDNRQFLDGRYVLAANNDVRFEVSAYDETRPLIIDPVLSYSTYLGGIDYDDAYGIAVDSAGSAFVVGETASVNFPTTLGALDTTCGTDGECNFDGYTYYSDVFVAKLNADGSALVFSTFLGGSQGDWGRGIAVDTSGDAYLTGLTESVDFPLAGPFQASKGLYYDAFVAKVSSTGDSLLYSTYLGGNHRDYAWAIAVDPSGNAYVTGGTTSTDFPTANPYQATCNNCNPYSGSQDVFVSKLNSAGSGLVYSTYLGGTGAGYQYGTDIVVDSAGRAYVTGVTEALDFPTVNALQPALSGSQDAFVTKFAPDGLSLVYSTYLGGTDIATGYGIAVDTAGNAYVTGRTLGVFPTTPGALQLNQGGSGDSFVTKLSADGSTVLYSTYLGGGEDDYVWDIAVDAGGQAYVTGYTRSDDFPLASPLQGTLGGPVAYDAFLAKVNATGSALIFSTYLGGSGNENAESVAIDAAGNALVAGWTESADFPTTPEAVQTSLGGEGSEDAFVAKFSGLFLPVASFSRTEILFADQPVGATSAPEEITLTNNGDVTLIFTSFNVQLGPTDTTPSPDFAQNNTCGFSLEAGASCTMNVLFTPSTEGTSYAYLVIQDSAWDSPHIVTLSGTGVQPALSLSAASLTLPGTPLDMVCPPRMVTLTNNGDAPLAINSIAISSEFTETNDCGASLAPGASCTITVVFYPAALGLRQGTLSIISNDPNSPHTVALEGEGLPPCNLLASRRSASVLRGTASTDFEVSDSNPSCSPDPIELSCSGNDPATCTFSPAIIPPSGSSRLRVGNLVALRAEALNFVVNSRSDFRTASIGLTVLLKSFAFTAAPDAKTLRAGETATYALAIRPVNGFTGEVALSCSGAPRGATCTVTPSQVTLDGASLAKATVTVTTTARAMGAPSLPQGPLSAPWLVTLAFGLLLLTGLVALAGESRRVRQQLGAAGLLRSRRRAYLALVTALVAVAMWAACGGGGFVSINQSSGTLPGTSALTISGTYTSTQGEVAAGAPSQLTHSTTVHLTVN